MITKGRKKGTIRFALKPSNGVKKVFLAGDFSDWAPVRMRKQKDGRYAITIALSAGTYHYKYQADEDWLLDPDNYATALNPFGTLNSLVEVQ